MTVSLVISLQGKANGKQENSSITASKYLLPCIDDGKDTLKSLVVGTTEWLL